MFDLPTETVESEQSFLSMSDTEIMAAMEPTDIKGVTAVAAPATQAAASEVVEVAPADTTANTVDDAGDADQGEGEGALNDTDEEGGTPTEQVSEAPGDKAPKTEKVDAAPKEGDKPVSTDLAPVDFEQEYKRLLAPFKANGHEITVGSVDDAISLMQMGANYNKKMAALKPNLKLMKMLENSGFMSEEKIGFLIDLGKKDPAAINKLVLDSGIDPMDFDAEKAKGYKQSTYAADDREIALDTVFDEIQATPTYTRTLDIVSNKWDAASKQQIAATPQLLRVINEHVSSGVYDLITTGVERERVFGRLDGLSDLEAYRQVGDALQAAGKFNHLGHQATPKPAPVIVVPKPAKVEDGKLKEKRRAASSTTTAAPSATATEFNPLSLSDEEFSKLGNKKFI